MARVWLFLLGIALAACAMDDCAMDDKGTVGDDLANCARRGPGQETGSIRTEHPFTHEAGSFVGLATEEHGPGNFALQRFALLNCQTREISRLEMAYDTTTASADGSTFFARIDQLRRQGRLTRPGQLERLSTTNGWSYLEGQISFEKIERAKCACESHMAQKPVDDDS